MFVSMDHQMVFRGESLFLKYVGKNCIYKDE